MYRADMEGGSASTAEEPSADAPALEKAAEILAEEAAAPTAQRFSYERIAATSFVDAAVEPIFGRVSADEELVPFLEGIDMTWLRGHTVEWGTPSNKS